MLAEGASVAGKAGGDKGDMANAATPDIVAAKFRELGQDGGDRALDMLSGISSLESLRSVSAAV